VSWKWCCVTFMLIVLVGCDGDTHRPTVPYEEPGDYSIRDLQLSVNISDDTIARGDTLDIYMVVWNPKQADIDVWFTDTCQEAFWVYDDKGQDVSPPYGCFEMPTKLHMEPKEKRTYHLTWIACHGIEPGWYNVAAGFRPLIDDTAYTSDPLAVLVLGRDEDVTGAWTGVSFDFWGIPGWADYHITLDLVQRGASVTGTVRAGGPGFEIYNGSIENNELVLVIRLEADDLEIEFTGDVCGDGVEGWRRQRRISTGELLDTEYWHAERVKGR
jgi:uncharacterized protein YcfL